VNPRFDTDKYESGYIREYIERIKAPRRILEVGVRHGGSLLLWCDLWPSVEKVIGIDINPPLQEMPAQIQVLQADQTDAARLHDIASSTGPFDLIVDDASHLGDASWKTFRALWPHVVPGGIYVVEDWGTGYWSHWADGADYRDVPAPGHTAGMVGMIKRLVDEIGNGDMGRLDILPGLAFAHKRLPA
jgi:demethylmacrocin O-methyltransferase